jgi:hypothetical protein
MAGAAGSVSDLSVHASERVSCVAGAAPEWNPGADAGRDGRGDAMTVGICEQRTAKRRARARQDEYVVLVRGSTERTRWFE